ncbi:MAG: prephenate dehydrogenase/arogenate dehydrogenase family protein [Chloroflexota bacterium]
MSVRPPATVAFLGFGLIGGSIAQAITRGANPNVPAGRPRLTAWTPSGRGPALAVEDGIIDLAAATEADALEGADLVVIAAPPLEAIALVKRLGSELAPFLAPGALVTDVASTKGAIVSAAVEAGIRFVGGHPMAGRETSGYASASRDLFVDRPWIIVTPEGTPDATAEPVRWLARRCGARPVAVSARVHDASAAAVSHLPLIAAAALVEAVCLRDPDAWATAGPLAASGWASATRLARGDPRMGAGIIVTNAAEVAAQLRALRAALDSWLAVVEAEGGPDADAIERRLATARAALAPNVDPHE